VTVKPFDVTAWLENRNGCEGSPCVTPEAPVTIGPDPYALEIHDDSTLHALCVECRRKSALEV
jgi:hypothetical protein